MGEGGVSRGRRRPLQGCRGQFDDTEDTGQEKEGGQGGFVIEEVKNKILEAIDCEEVKEMIKEDDSGIDVMEYKDCEVEEEEVEGYEVNQEVEVEVVRRRQEELARLLMVKQGPLTRSLLPQWVKVAPCYEGNVFFFTLNCTIFFFSLNILN